MQMMERVSPSTDPWGTLLAIINFITCPNSKTDELTLHKKQLIALKLFSVYSFSKRKKYQKNDLTYLSICL